MLLLDSPGGRGGHHNQLLASGSGELKQRDKPESDYNLIMQSSPYLFLHMDEFVYICILFYLIICIEFKLK